MKNLISDYNRKKYAIKNRLKEFSDIYKSKKAYIFQELCFCLLTPQSKAVYCDRAVKELRNSGLLFKGGKGAVKSKLKGVRFPNNKAMYLLCARKLLKADKSLNIGNKLSMANRFDIRERLVKNVKGLGYKEASHFLRNIGLGKDMAILDVHILRNLKRFGIIKKMPASINRKTYIDIENKMRKFSRKTKIPMQDLDLLFWSRETGFVLK